MKEIKILNLYAGIGGNRKFWSDNEEYKIKVTAIEYDQNIAKIYKDNFPNDEVIITDAHKFLLENFRNYDFIWSSPPCPTHSKVRKQLAFKKRKDGTLFEQNKPVYPNMSLYEEIILLDNYYKGLYVVENVIPYYDPLIEPQILGRHCLWSNMEFPKIKIEARGSFDNINELSNKCGFDISNYKNINKKLVLRNCVEPEISKIVFKTLLEKLKER